MSEGVRRNHLIFAGGVGGLSILRDGTSVICAGLDYWFRTTDGRVALTAIEENKVTDWRLEAKLRVDELRTPPSMPAFENGDSSLAGIPFLRFPLWHVCPSCRRLRMTKNKGAQPFVCHECKAERNWSKARRMIQVPLVAACEGGHLQEFPWRKWLNTCLCEEPDLRLSQSGGTGLRNYRLSCKRCGKSRSMGAALDENALGGCSGGRPWFLDGDDTRCQVRLQGALRNSASLYYSAVASSVFLPRGDATLPEGLKELSESAPIQLMLSMLDDKTVEQKAQKILEKPIGQSSGYSLEQWVKALSGIEAEMVESSALSTETDYRAPEYELLGQEAKDFRLRVRQAAPDTYSFAVDGRVESVGLVESLVMTKALTGFSRLLPPSTGTRSNAGVNMWKRPQGTKWLPATQVRGEGVFLRLSEAVVRAWEQRTTVARRVARVLEEAKASSFVAVDHESIGPRYILLHTLAHVLMNRMVFEAGYSTASLSERIYSRPPGTGATPMAGLLIYTASGDSEGSLGGLVRLGRPGVLERLLDDAIEEARWCSSDPICMELGGTEQQGPDGLNLAACHACVHLPETACENFNVLLDRALLIGSLTDPSIGFFNSAE